MDQVTIVIRNDPTADGPFIKAVYKHYGDAELFVNRQANPLEYTLTVQQVLLNG